MISIPFIKFHGFGNDYIVIEAANIPDAVDLSELGRSICDRHRGAGADGIAVLSQSADSNADYTCEIINPDGSVADFSGNGTRCAVSYLYYVGLWSETDLKLSVKSGIKKYTLLNSDGLGHYEFQAEIGSPKFNGRDVPMITTDDTKPAIDQPININGKEFLVSGVNIGNPVACVFVDDLELDWRTYGRELESHAVFPKRANIVFVKVIDQSNIEIKIWERGAAETSSSGTCSCGAAVLSAFTGRTGRDLQVKAEGGVTHVLWRDDDEMMITGVADLAYKGEWPI